MFFETVSRLLVLVLLASAPFHTIKTTAFPNEGVPQSTGPTSVGKAAITMELLTPTEGADFNPYLREVYLSVKKSWFANMPPSVEKGEQGLNIVAFRVLQDGNITNDSLRISARKSDLDAASLKAVREAAPFSHLPEKFTQPFVELRFNFYYNLPVPTK